MTKAMVNGKLVFEAPYSEEDKNEIINKVRIEERYIANSVLGDLGIPADRRPKIYVEAGNIVMSMILGPASKPADDQPKQD